MTTHTKPRTLATALALRFGLVAAIPLAALVLLAMLQIVPRYRADVARQHEALSSAMVAQLERYFGGASQELFSLGKIVSRGVSGGDDLNTLLDTYVTATNVYEAIYLTDPQGRVRAIGMPADRVKERRNHLGLDFSQRDFYQQAKAQGRAVWSNSFLSPVTARMTIAVAQPIGSDMLIGEVAVSPLMALVKSITAKGSFSILMLDRQDQMVMHSGGAFAGQQINLGNLPIVAAARREARTEVMLFDLWGEAQVGVARGLGGPDWMVVVAQPQSQAYEQINALWAQLAVATVVSLCVAALAAVLTARSLARRFIVYGELAESIADGQYETSPRRERISEFNRLQSNLKRMSEAIGEREQAMQRSQLELQALNVTLEERVSARTQELTRANADLVQAMNTLKQAQDELGRSERLASLGAMVAGVAHELNTPIGSSVLAASTLGERVTAFTSDVKQGVPMQRRALMEFLSTCESARDILLSNLNRASELISNFKQVAVDQASAHRRRFRISEVINEQVLSLQPILKKTPFEFDIEVDEDLWFDSYPGPLGQVIVNLLSNAILHGFEGRQDGRLSVRAQAQGDNALITVSDNGVGIADEYLPRIFDPFFTTKLGRGGSGLGLHIVHNIVTLTLGGNIEVSTELGKGSCFTICLPRVAPTATPQAGPEQD